MPGPRRPRRPLPAARLLPAGLGLLLAGCLPSYSAFLRLPLQVQAPAAGQAHATARLELAEVRQRMAAFDPAAAAFYFRGRRPLPHRYVDDDRDGTPDAVILELPTDAGEHWVVVVSPR